MDKTVCALLYPPLSILSRSRITWLSARRLDKCKQRSPKYHLFSRKANISCEVVFNPVYTFCGEACPIILLHRVKLTSGIVYWTEILASPMGRRSSDVISCRGKPSVAPCLLPQLFLHWSPGIKLPAMSPFHFCAHLQTSSDIPICQPWENLRRLSKNGVLPHHGSTNPNACGRPV